MLLVAAFCGILFRLYWIQMIAVHSFSREEADLITEAEEQQSGVFMVDSGRGQILDRNGISLTGERDWRLIVFPLSESQWRVDTDKLNRVARIIGLSPREFRETVKALRRPQVLHDRKGKEEALSEKQAEAIQELEVPGVYALKTDYRQDPDRLARQVIGRVERNPFLIRERYPDEWTNGRYQAHSRIGVTGLEAAFEPFLRGGRQHLLTYITDGGGRPLNGLHMATRESGGAIPYRVVSTLDQRAQRVAEKNLEEAGVTEGAVVVQDLASGDILAMASRPSLESAGKNQNPWNNRALMEMTPGSIFKTVTAVAALDTGKVKPGETFDCNGHLGRYGMKDSKPGGHGRQSLEEAYANSCNVVFARVAERVGGKTLKDYAHRMGVGERILWSGPVFKEKDFRQLPQEQTGLIFSKETSLEDSGAVAQTGIGQRDVKVTPLQAVNMVTTLFQEGKTLNPRIAREIQRPDGEVLYRFPPHALKTEKKIASFALERVRHMMRLAVTDGTARSLQGASLALGAKTGTAQVGPDKDTYNKWMVGYGPYEKPRFAAAVVIRSVRDSGDMRAHEVFRKVMEGLEKELKGEKKG
ncbi:cell division protein FtsI/penicillin-binding protein 2 [Melghirimyces profundicolus]|uniref:Cell division protein FtsI/penicillin-binding protein 2 n=1 Tax=Melghirimyces profundicolus TaxID=1242148 RepID=A0A2T6BQY3_9BACL|nr:cell division protein FtsI/penicillin-binding protein 2 [Melghirimyces profundicolus]